MPDLFHLFLQNVLSPLLMVCFVILVLCSIAIVDGVPIARALLVLSLGLFVSCIIWSFKIVIAVLSMLFPALGKGFDDLFGRISKSPGKGKKKPL